MNKTNALKNDDNCLLTTIKICKNFGPTQAVKDVSLEFNKGEIRGLVGENGSGKSTLLTIIAGIQSKNSGEMMKNGRFYNPHNPITANKNGVNIVVQELGLVEGLTVAENIYLGKTALFCKNGILNVRKMYRTAREAFKTWGIKEIPLDLLTGKLTVEEKKLVELVRALSTNPDILILDEITAALSHDNRKMLYKLMADLKKDGKAVLFVSHDLQEVIDLSDRITVMKDGQVVETLDAGTVDEDGLKRLMVGREIKDMYYHIETQKDSHNKEEVLKVEDFTVDDTFTDLTFSLYRGEVLGIGGLSGSGIHPLGKALFGLLKKNKGRVYLSSKGQEINNIRSAIKNGISYVPKDRDAEALMVNASIEENLCLPSIDSLKGVFGFINPAKTRKFSKNLVVNFQIKTEGVKQTVNQLSGGNRQKVSLAGWWAKENEVLILDSPTRGVDVGVKANIYKLIAEAKREGISVILISDELPELIGASDRLMVMKNGGISKIFKRVDGFNENLIIEVMI